MKITKEQLQDIDVEAYITHIENRCNEMHSAALTLPFYKDQDKALHLNRWGWHSYFLQNGKTSAWYERYEKLAEAKATELDAEIKKQKKALDNVIALASPEQTAQIINKHSSNFDLELAENIDFRHIKGQLVMMRRLFETSIETDLEAINEKLRFDKGAINRALNEAENDDFQFLEWVLDGNICRQYIDDCKVVFEFARLEFLHRLASPNTSNTAITIKPIQTLGKTEFVELVKALLLAKSLQYSTEKEAVEALALALNVRITKPEFDRILQKIKYRNKNEETKFIDDLKGVLRHWIYR